MTFSRSTAMDVYSANRTDNRARTDMFQKVSPCPSNHQLLSSLFWDPLLQAHEGFLEPLAVAYRLVLPVLWNMASVGDRQVPVAGMGRVFPYGGARKKNLPIKL